MVDKKDLSPNSAANTKPSVLKIWALNMLKSIKSGMNMI